MDPDDLLNTDPLWDLIESEEFDDIEYDDSSFASALDSSNDF